MNLGFVDGGVRDELRGVECKFLGVIVRGPSLV